MEILWAILFWVLGLGFAASTAGVGFIAMLLGFIVGAIGQSKGYGFWGWSLWGMALFIVALPHVLLTPKKDQTPPSFRVDGSYEGVAYRNNADGSVTARLDGTDMTFANDANFRAFLETRRQRIASAPPASMG